MLAAIVRFIQEWKRYNQSLSELNRLGDRELADIGISRSDIQRVAWSAARTVPGRCIASSTLIGESGTSHGSASGENRLPAASSSAISIRA